MERFIAIVCLIFSFFAFLVGVCHPAVLRSWGVDLLREYQLYRWRAETSRWPVLSDGRFIIKYQQGDEADARLVLQEAERVYHPLGELFGYYPRQPVPISIYTNRNSLNRIFGWGSEESAMGVYWAGTMRVLSPRVWLEDLPGGERERVFQERGPVAHEYIHLLVDYKTRGNYPRWLTEGLAQYGEERMAGVPPVNRSALPLTVSLEELDQRFDEPAWQDYSYGVARDLVLYLVNRYGEASLPRLLNALGEGKNLNDALHQVTGSGLNQFLAGYQRYARGV